MPFQQANSLRYFTFESLTKLPIKHAVFTRQGGISENPFAQLNVGGSVGDNPGHVSRNIDKVFSALDRPRTSLFDSRLVHGSHALVAEEPRPLSQSVAEDADIIMTRNPDVSLFMRYADCLPLLFYDPQQHAIALAHAGWKGTVQKVASKTVSELAAHFNSQAGDLIVAIGPGICAEHYEVGDMVINDVEKNFGEKAPSLLPKVNGSTYFDLVAANTLALKEAGVSQIETAGLCTYADTQDWFSHRAEGGKTGRFGVLLALDSR
jgi:YfiH family protein